CFNVPCIPVQSGSGCSRPIKKAVSTESRFLMTVWTMCASIFTTIPALQEIPRRQDKLPIFVEVVIYPFYRLTARDVILSDGGRRIIRGNVLKIFGYFFFNDLFRTSRAATILTKIKRHDWRIVTTPTSFIPAP